MKPGEKILAIVFLIFSFVAFYLSYSISGFESMSSPGSFPMIVSAVLITSAIFVMRDAFAKDEKNSGNKSSSEEEKKSKASTFKILFPHSVIIFIIGSVIYVFLMTKITFIYASLIYIMFIGLYFKNKQLKLNIKEIVKIGLISVITVTIVYLIFQEVFNVILP